MDVIWTVSHATLTGAERCTVRDTGQGWALSGVVAASYEARPIDVQYRVAVDEGWATRSVNVTVDLLTQSRNFSSKGRPRLAGPSTVDQPESSMRAWMWIWGSAHRRTPFRFGESTSKSVGSQEIHVTWVKFPDLRVEPGRQRYARIAVD